MGYKNYAAKNPLFRPNITEKCETWAKDLLARVLKVYEADFELIEEFLDI